MVTLVSDLILYNENGVLTTEIGVMKEYLESLLDVKNLEIINPFLQFTTIGGFNVTWNRRKSIFNALGKGSTFLLHSETGFDAGLLSGEFLGERVTEGYGEILVEEPLKKAEVEIKKNSWEKVIEEDAKADRAGIMQLLLQSEFERRVQSEVRRKLNEKKSKYETRRKALNPAISKIRLIFKTELTYEAMLDQIKGIESEEKNGLCTELTALIVPEQIKVEITEKMEQDYHIKFNNSLNYEELYRHVYRAYITELKQFVRTLEKEDDTK
jgi:CRISPR-associated protein Csx10